MFGAYRFVLALMVFVTHIGGVEIIGGVAVWGFFVLSGFLMTAVLNRKYGFSGHGLLGFSKSRALRLLPAYWAAVALTLVAIYVGDGRASATQINEALAVPTTLRDILANVFVLGHTTFGIGRIGNALVPSAWAIDVEILMYMCSVIFIARSERIARFVFAGTLVAFPFLWLAAKFSIARGEAVLADQLIYSFLPAALFPYAAGSWLWFRREKIPAWFTSVESGAIAAAAIAVCIFLVGRVSVTLAYVASLPCLVILVSSLSRARMLHRWRNIDSFLGWMSYPIYLTHVLCAYVVVLAAPNSAMLFTRTDHGVVFSGAGFFVVLCVTISVAALFALSLERPLEKIRQRSTSLGLQPVSL